MNTNDNVCRTVVLASCLLALGRGRFTKPVCFLGELFLLQENITQKLNMTARKQIVATVDIHDALTRLRTRPLQELAELTLLKGRFLRLGLERRAPEPDFGTGSLGGLISGIQGQPVIHGRGRGLVPRPGLRRHDILQRLDEVGAGAEQHAADEVGSGDAWGAFNNLEAPSLLNEAITVVAVAVRGNVVAVDDVFAAKVGDVGQLGNIGGMADGAGDPAAGVGGSETLFEVHDGRALVGHDVLVGVHAAIELVAELASLDHGASMA